MPAILEAIHIATRRKQRENATAIWAEYQQLLRDAVAGKEVCEAKAEQAGGLLELLKKTDEEFRADIEVQRQREADAVLRNQLPKLRDEAQRLERELQAAELAYNEFVRRERPRIQSLSEQQAAAGARADAAEFASARLFNTYHNPVVLEQERELSRQCIAKQEQIAAQRERMKEQCERPLANVVADLRKARQHTADCEAVGRDPGNVTPIKNLELGMSNLEARRQREERILNGLLAEEGFLQSELQTLALKHYEV